MAKIFGLGSLNTSTGVNKLVAVKNSQHYVWNSSTGAWNSQNTFVQFGDKVEFFTFLDKLFAVNRLNNTRTYDGVDWVTTNTGFVDKAPRGAYGLEFNVRAYIADIVLHGAGDAFRSRVWYSDLPSSDLKKLTWGFEQGTTNSLTMTAGSPVVTDTNAQFITRNIKSGDPITITGQNGGEHTVSSIDSETQLTLTKNLSVGGKGSYWVGGNWIDYKTNNSDYIRGMSQNSEKLLLFKKNALGKSNGVDSAKDVKAAPGTTSHRSIVNLGEYTYYFHPTGIWRYDGVSSRLISNPIYDYIDGVAASFYPDVVGWSEDERYLKMAIGDVTNHYTGLSVSDCVVVLDTIDNQWSIETKAFTPTAITKFEESNAVNTYAGGDDGNVYQMDTGNSWDGEDMPFELYSGAIFPVGPEIPVQFTRILAFADPALGISGRYKLLYNQDKRIPVGYQPFNLNTEEGGSFGGKQMVEWRFPQTGGGDIAPHIASGIEIHLNESSSAESFLFERMSVLWKNATLF